MKIKLHENDTQCTENIVNPNAKHQFSILTNLPVIIYKLAPCQRFRFGIMEIWTRNSEKLLSARKCADRLRRGAYSMNLLYFIRGHSFWYIRTRGGLSEIWRCAGFPPWITSGGGRSINNITTCAFFNTSKGRYLADCASFLYRPLATGDERDPLSCLYADTISSLTKQ